MFLVRITRHCTCIGRKKVPNLYDFPNVLRQILSTVTFATNFEWDENVLRYVVMKKEKKKTGEVTLK